MSAVKAAKPATVSKAKPQPQKTKASEKKNADAMVLKPRMSEKAYDLSHSLDTYVFDVPASTNKAEVAKAVASQFKVTVEDVRILVLKGKKARSIRIGGTRKYVYGKRPNTKKAYIRIKKGETIPIFASIDEAEEKAKKAEAKAAKKSTKPEKTVEKAKNPASKAVKTQEKKTEDKAKPRRGLFGFRRGPKESK